MANHLQTSRDATRVGRRHGKDGNVRLHVDIDPRVKDRLIRLAERDGVAFASVVRDALDFYLDGVGA